MSKQFNGTKYSRCNRSIKQNKTKTKTPAKKTAKK